LAAENQLLKRQVEESKGRLNESEQSRLSLQEQLDTSKHTFESEITFLHTQLQVYTEDFNEERQRREKLQTEFNRVQSELSLAQRQVGFHFVNVTIDQIQQQQDNQIE
jgi:hypothetical protein